MSLRERRFLSRIAMLTVLMIFGLQTTRGQQISFDSSVLQGTTLTNGPTSLQFGPDGRLYVAERFGFIKAYTITRNGDNDYQVSATEEINLIREIANHDDDGDPNSTIKRQLTGIVVTGTATAPIIYASSSDSREGGNSSASDTNLDTNSGTISRLAWDGSNWQKIDLVRGLPRSEENHATNGLQLSVTGDTLFVAQGGSTNAGAPSNNFAYITEYALGAAILSVDLAAIDALPTQIDGEGTSYRYDIPTLDDPTRSNANGIHDPTSTEYDGVDIADPFGGNDGLNQAKIVPGGPVQVYSSGWRNPYDLLVTRTPGRAGRMYAIDNGANGGWGGHPVGEGPDGNCTNDYDPDEPGSTGPGPNDDKINNLDNLHLITGSGFYAGHPAPIRGNPSGAGLYTYDTAGTWRTLPEDLPADWPPVPAANAIECDYRNPGVDDGALYTWKTSTNGLAEYADTSFGGVMQGNLLATSFDGDLYRIELNAAGDAVTTVVSLASNLGDKPLDVTAQGTGEVFGGTIWVASLIDKQIYVLEPVRALSCSGAYDIALDEDSDGYNNADELDNGTDPCSASSTPPDHDSDFISDLNDTDDDNDGLLDATDYFVLDPKNGITTNLPIYYPFYNEDPGTGFFGLGFTGLMSNGIDDYLSLFDEDLLIAGGTSGLFTVDGVSDGNATGGTNSQQNAFQFGINVSTGTGTFTVRSRIKAPFFNASTPIESQSQGMFIGTGDQDNYLKIALAANGGNGGIEILLEESGVVSTRLMYADNQSGDLYIPDDVLAATALDFHLMVDPATGTVQPGYAVNSGTINSLGFPLPLSGALLNAVQSSAAAMATGLIATSAGSGTPFTATWDEIEVTGDPGEVRWLYRVNAGGAAISDPTFSWSEDTDTNPSPYLVAGGEKTRSSSFNGTNNTDAPDAVFETYRWDPNRGAEMHWEFPLSAAGTYEVRLYFAETWSKGHQMGARVFDVIIEGQTVLDDYDVYAENGKNAVMKSFIVDVVDGEMNVDIDVEFGHVMENPLVNGLGVLSTSATSTASQLAASPTGLDFGQVASGSTSTQSVTLTNSDGTEEITISGLSLTGDGDFTLGTAPTLPHVLTPGQSVNVEVVFTPSSTGLKSATLSAVHDGSNPTVEVPLSGEGVEPSANLWQVVSSSTAPAKRHENAFIRVADKFYLVGGRGSKTVDVYEPSSNSWTTGSLPPIELHHFQGLELNGLIYVMGAYTGSGTSEAAVTHIYTYDPATDSWTQGPEIPSARQRGSAGAVLYNDKIYLVCGSVGGHGSVSERKAWFDEYDPATGVWTPLADAPRGRDHFQAAVVNSKLYVAGGRDGGRSSTIAEVDVYDFTAGQWSTLPSSANIPTQRAGVATVVVGNEIIVIGGETEQDLAHDQTEALDATTDTWRTLDNLNTGRHGTQALVYNGSIYIAAGSATKGAGDELTSQEVLVMSSTIPSQLVASPTSLDYGQVASGSTSTQSVTLTNSDGTEDVTISDLSLTGDGDFTLGTAPTLPHVLTPGQSLDVEVVFTPSSTGLKSATLSVVHDGSNPTVEVPLSGEGVEVGETTWLYRVNAGGASISDPTLSWSEDTDTNPSPYLVAGGEKIKSSSFNGANNTDAPDAVFDTYRWDPDRGAEMHWEFPLSAAGTYEVRLYFAETHTNAQMVGGRVFDVIIEGETVLQDYDLYAEAGKNAVMKSFIVDVVDGEMNVDIDVEFGHVVENPFVNALGVLSTGGDTSTTSQLTLASSTHALASFAGLTLKIEDASGASNALRISDRRAEPGSASGWLEAPVKTETSLEGDEAAPVDAAIIELPVSARPLWIEFAGLSAEAVYSVTERRAEGLGASYQVHEGSRIAVVEAAVTALVLRKAAVEALPTRYALEQNYPNPFNPQTTIRYELPEAAHVELAIYNILGQLVRVLVDELQEAGRYEVAWNSAEADMLSSGLYVYRLRAGSFTQTRMMHFLK